MTTLRSTLSSDPTDPPILVCGEALFDVFPASSTPVGLMLDARIGGSPFNVAMGLRRLGRPAAFLGAISRDAAGERLMQALVDETIDTGAVSRTAARSTLSLVGLDAQGVASYAFYGEGGADRQLPAAALATLPPKVAAIHVGSYSTVVEPIASTLEQLIEREQGNTPIAYDPNVRLNVEPDLTTWRMRLAWMLPRCQILKVSDEDLERLYPGREVEAFAAEAVGAGVALLVVTRGADGASAWVAGEPRRVPPVEVQVVDTVGAGDTFQAALLARLSELDVLSVAGLSDTTVLRQAAADALPFAARAAAITCSRRGADLPRRNEL